MKFFQKEIAIKPYSRGFHLITDSIISEFPEIKDIQKGQLQVFIKHTSASLTINENASYYRHTYEGSDDMPAHIKSSVLGSSVQIPITNGKLNLGIWQGIYLCEHRNYGGSRQLVVTAFGN